MELNPYTTKLWCAFASSYCYFSLWVNIRISGRLFFFHDFLFHLLQVCIIFVFNKVSNKGKATCEPKVIFKLFPIYVKVFFGFFQTHVWPIFTPTIHKYILFQKLPKRFLFFFNTTFKPAKRFLEIILNFDGS